MKETNEILSNGIYTIAEAATYSRLHINTLKRWAEINDIKEIENLKILTFLDLIQSLAIREIRRQHKISLQKIKEAVMVAQDKYNIEYPFAHEHTTYLLDKDIYIKVDNDDDLTKATGKNRHQMISRKLIEVYLKDLHFGADGLACSYRPLQGIILDPKFHFGEPLVEKAKIPAFILWEAVKAEGSFENVAKAYGIELEEVKNAAKYIETLNIQAA